MVFVNGHYSHATLRLSAADDRRTASHYGVRVSPVHASDSARAAARACLGTLPQMPFVSRNVMIRQAVDDRRPCALSGDRMRCVQHTRASRHRCHPVSRCYGHGAATCFTLSQM